MTRRRDHFMSGLRHARGSRSAAHPSDSGMITGMAVRGRVQRGNESTYQIDSGLPHRTTVNLAPHTAVRAVQAARAMGISVSGLLHMLVDQMQVDESGRPVWADDLDAVEGRLPIAG